MTTNTKYITFFVISIISLAAFIILSAKLYIDISKESKTNVKKEDKYEFNKNKNSQKTEELINFTNQPKIRTKQKIINEDSFADQDKTPFTSKQVENDLQEPTKTIFKNNKTLDNYDNLKSTNSKIYKPVGKNLSDEDLELKNNIEDSEKNSYREDLKELTIDHDIFFLELDLDESTKDFNKKFINQFLQPCEFPTILKNYLIEKFEYLNLNSKENIKIYFQNSYFFMFHGIFNFFIEQLKDNCIISQEQTYKQDFLKKLSNIKLDANWSSVSDCKTIYDHLLKINTYKLFKTSIIIDLYSSLMVLFIKNVLQERKINNNYNLINYENDFNGEFEINLTQKNPLENSQLCNYKDLIENFLIRRELYTLVQNYEKVFLNMVSDLDQETNNKCEIKILNYPQLLILQFLNKKNFGNTNFLKEYSQIDLPSHFNKNEKLSKLKQTYKLIYIFCKIRIKNQDIFFNFYKLGDIFIEIINKKRTIRGISEDIINEIIRQTTGDILLVYEKKKN
ncbi:hypothetical protein GVAV_001662 [Gurleya vavrai]